MKRFYQDADISLAPLQDKTIAIIGYGNQGRPQALNLKDSGLNVITGCRPGSPKMGRAQQDGINAFSIPEAMKQAQVILMLMPDEAMNHVFTQHIEPYIAAGSYLGFGHGMGIHAGWVTPKPDINVFLLAPKGQGKGVRGKFLEGSGVPGLVAVHQDPSGDTKDVALAYGKGIGCGRTGILNTTFAQETETDLFSEQTVLCGGLTQLIQNAYDVLVEAGYDHESAYFECLYEVKLIGDLLQADGITGMREKISSTALFGDITRGPKVIDSHVKENMRRVLEDIQSGQFAREFKATIEQHPNWKRQYEETAYHHPLEATGRWLREQDIL